ncbi:MAG: XRE family transcriptional regulator [Deltaproteobacteria bacterium]|nr:XRE family transcriptional regulator [Deltaproteobacteria bacterium]
MNRRLKSKIIERFGCQADFALKVGVNESVVSRVVTGRRKLNEEEQARWIRILKTGKEVFSNE